MSLDIPFYRTVSCDETKHETTSPEQDHSITSARSNGWAECRDKKSVGTGRRGRMSLDIPFYRTVSCDETKHETTSPEQDHSITSARSNGWAECRDKKNVGTGRRGRMSLDIPFYRTVSCDETKHETTSPEQDHSITSACSNGWAECRSKKSLCTGRRGRMSLDIPFYRTVSCDETKHETTSPEQDHSITSARSN